MPLGEHDRVLAAERGHRHDVLKLDGLPAVPVHRRAAANDVLAQVYVRSLGEGGTPLVLGVETIPKSAGINR